MKAIKELRFSYYVFFIASMIFSIVLLVGIIVLFFSEHIFFEIEESTSHIIKYSLILMLCIAESYFVYKLIVCLKNFNSIRKNKFKTIIGTVYKYARNESEMGQQLNSHPIIKLLNSEETIELFINKGTELNKSYRFIYLKHTKIGAVEEEYLD